jgi:metallo-beta-lactamase class B
LLDSGFAETVPQIERNIATLGFRLSDVKLLLNSHAHFDHAGGLARLKELTGAKLVASAADAELLARGGKGDFHFADRLSYAPVKTDRVISDNEEITLGSSTLTAHLTPGHTKGCTTWTTTTEEGGHRYHVVFLGGVTIPGYRLIDNAQYPNIATDYAHTFDVLNHLRCDVFLGAHGSYFGFEKKHAKLGEVSNPFVDPDGYRNYVTELQRTFEETLRQQKAAAVHTH